MLSIEEKFLKLNIFLFENIFLYSSSVLRSQSYHSGVGNQGMYTDNYSNVNLRMGGVNQRGNVNRWTLTSNESSDFDEEYVEIS
jgi:hypothetical protein